MAFMTLSLEQFFNDNFVSTSPHRPIAQENYMVLKNQFSQVLTVRGDGNCLIYTVVTYLVYTRNFESIIDILIPYIDEESINDILNNPKKLINYYITEPRFMNKIAENIRQSIKKNWDYDVPLQFQMDQNAIDGYAREMVLRLLGVEKLIVYSLYPDKEQNSKIFKPSKKFFTIQVPYVVTLICAQGYTHYSVLK